MIDEVSREIEENIKRIYNDCWFIYKEYLGSHDLAQYNRRVCELKEKYPDEEFLKDILYGFIKKLNTLQARYLMALDGRITATGKPDLSPGDQKTGRDMVNYLAQKGREAKK